VEGYFLSEPESAVQSGGIESRPDHHPSLIRG
jgi:hypothetical protein